MKTALAIVAFWLVASASADAATRSVTLRWVPDDPATVAGYRVHLSSQPNNEGSGIDVGPLAPNAQSIVSYTVAELDDSLDLFVSVTAYGENGATSAPSNSIFLPAAQAPPAPMSAQFDIRVTDGAETPLFDASGAVALEIGGINMIYLVEVAPNGRVRGTGAADVDQAGPFETGFAVRGRVRGTGKDIDVRTTFRVQTRVGGTHTAMTAVRRETIDAGAETRSAEVKISGKVSDVRVSEVDVLPAAVASSDLGWRLQFDLDGTPDAAMTTSGRLTYGASKTVDVRGSAKYSSRTGLLNGVLRSRGTDRGVVFKLRNVRVEAGVITGGTLEYKAFGQRGSLSLPSQR